MKINVTNVGEPWTPPSGGDALYTIHVEGVGEPQKTFDKALAVVGEHEAEQYQSKTGKTYYRTPKPSGGYAGPRAATGPKEFKADPAKMKQDLSLEVARNQSIQRQVAVKAAVDLIVAGKIEYDEMYRTYGYIMELLTNHDWRSVVNPGLTPEDAAALLGGEILPTDEEVDDLDLSELPS